jgi:hypothetical protein
MQTLKGAAPATFAARNNRAASLGISPREYLSLGRFSNAADKFGLQTTAITKGPFGAGARLTMSSGSTNYELDVTNGRIMLGKAEPNGRVRLCECSSTQAGWETLLAALQTEVKK